MKPWQRAGWGYGALAAFFALAFLAPGERMAREGSPVQLLTALLFIAAGVSLAALPSLPAPWRWVAAGYGALLAVDALARLHQCLALGPLESLRSTSLRDGVVVAYAAAGLLGLLAAGRRLRFGRWTVLHLGVAAASAAVYALGAGPVAAVARAVAPVAVTLAALESGAVPTRRPAVLATVAAALLGAAVWVSQPVICPKLVPILQRHAY